MVSIRECVRVFLFTGLRYGFSAIKIQCGDLQRSLGHNDECMPGTPGVPSCKHTKIWNTRNRLPSIRFHPTTGDLWLRIGPPYLASDALKCPESIPALWCWNMLLHLPLLSLSLCPSFVGKSSSTMFRICSIWV